MWVENSTEINFSESLETSEMHWKERKIWNDTYLFVSLVWNILKGFFCGHDVIKKEKEMCSINSQFVQLEQLFFLIFLNFF